MGNNQTLKPGMKSPVSGIIEVLGQRGRHTGQEVVVDKNEIIPPTPEAGQSYRIVRSAHHKRG